MKQPFKKLILGALCIFSTLSLAACNINISLNGGSSNSEQSSSSSSSSESSSSSIDEQSSSSGSSSESSSSSIDEQSSSSSSSSESSSSSIDEQSSSSSSSTESSSSTASDTTSEDISSDEDSTADDSTTDCEHVYEYDCDEFCAECGQPREPLAEHIFENACSSTCTVCGTIFVVESPHFYDDFLDVSCNECGYEREKITITFYHSYGFKYQEILNSAIERFNQDYPNVTIITSMHGGYEEIFTNIQFGFQIGSAPSLAIAAPDHIALYEMIGQALPLDNFANSESKVTKASGEQETLGLTQQQIDNFLPFAYNQGKQFDDEKTLYGLPMYWNTEVMYFNKTYFTQHGLTVPTTWKEMETLCQTILQIEAENGNNRCVPLGIDSEINWFLNSAEQLGSSFINPEKNKPFVFNNAQNRSFAQTYRNWYQNSYVTTSNTYGGYTSDLFYSQGCYMSIANQAAAPYYSIHAFDVGVAPLPQWDTQNQKNLCRTYSLCLFKQDDTREEQAAWLFAKYLSTDVIFHAEYSSSSYSSPANLAVYENPVYAEFLSRADSQRYVTASTLNLVKELTDTFYFYPPHYKMNRASDTIRELLSDCLSLRTNNGQTDEQLIEELFSDAEEYLNED